MKLNFVELLKSCTMKKDLQRGIKIHEDIVRRGLLERNRYITTSLITMYVKCGELSKAQAVLDSLPVRDNVSWSVLITGYAQKGQHQDALKCFEQMKREGFSPCVVTLVYIVKACAVLRDIEKGTQVYQEIVDRGLLHKQFALATALVDMYAKCGVLEKAHEVFDQLSFRNVVTWTALIGGYAQHGQGHQALKCFEQMQKEGISPNAVTFVCILKACGSIDAIEKGKEIHDEIVKMSLLENDIVLGNALVSMYAKFGMLTKAEEVLSKLAFRDVVSWTALIAGYVQHGQSHQALKIFEQMQREGIGANFVTLICLLQACGRIGDVERGNQIHKEIVRMGLLKKDIALGNALIDMYVKCGALEEAQKLLNKLPTRDVVSWSCLITGYVQQGQSHQALKCFKQMQRDGALPNTITFISLLKACGSIGAIEEGKKIHDQVASSGFLAKDILLGNALIEMYAKCGELGRAEQILNELPVQDVVSWSVLITGYTNNELGYEALRCFEQMQRKGISPNAVIFALLLTACSRTEFINMGVQIHGEIVRQGLLEKDIVLGNAMVDMYAKCGLIRKAEEVLDGLPKRNVVSWNALIAGCIQHGQANQAMAFLKQMQREVVCPDAITFTCMLNACGHLQDIESGNLIHDEIITHGLLDSDIVLNNAMIGMYTKCGMLDKAQQLLDKISVRDIISWNTMIAGYAQQRKCHHAIRCFEQMQREGLSPNNVTFICILKACGSTGSIRKGKQIHDDIILMGLLENDVILGNALIDMYVKCGELQKAKDVLDELPIRNVISWNTIIAGYAEQGSGQQVVECIEEMRRQCVTPNAVTFTCLLKTCGNTGCINMGKQIHEEIVNRDLVKADIMLDNTLVAMYARCGLLDKAKEVLYELPVRNVVSWSALIAGYVQQGQALAALTCFRQMEREGISPDSVTILHVLNACSVSGLVEDAEHHFRNMTKLYGIIPSVEHYSCMVHAYGCHGQFDKAMSLIRRMSCSDYTPVWLPLLSTCRKWENMTLGRLVFDLVMSIDGKYDVS